MTRAVQVNAYSEKWLRKGFPWVYPNELVGARPRLGQRVELRAADGAFLGQGVADDGWIAVRVLRHDPGPVDRDWLFGVLDRALALRQLLIGPDTTGYRLVHGENDGLPGVRVDWWSHHAVITLDTPSLAGLVEGVAAWLTERLEARGVHLCYRTDPRDDRDAASFEPRPGLVAGREPTGDVVVLERGLRARVRPAEGPDVGLYADMRDVRAWLEPHWGGRAVLNTFAYTGVFSVAAALGGATDVVTADLSPLNLERAADNFRANELDPERYEFEAGDTFALLDRYRRQGREFDVVILDPPSFSRSRDGRVWSARKDWPRLAAAAARVCAPDGWIVAASNQGEVSPREFRGAVVQGLERAGRAAQELHRGGQAPDFPALSTFPEGRYLKVGVWRLL